MPVCVFFLIGHSLLNISVKLIWSSTRKKTNDAFEANKWNTSRIKIIMQNAGQKKESKRTHGQKDRENDSRLAAEKKLKFTTFAHGHA